MPLGSRPNINGAWARDDVRRGNPFARLVCVCAFAAASAFSLSACATTSGEGEEIRVARTAPDFLRRGHEHRRERSRRIARDSASFQPPVIEPEPEPILVAEGAASWYGPGFNGRKTASGERFDSNALTAAHRELPFSSMVRVTRLDTGDSVMVRINDRGPFADDRIIDLSRAAAERLGFVADGLTEVRVEAFPVDEALHEAAPSRLLSPRRIAALRSGRGGAMGTP
jgi:rare lipoprotein A (peptidoglycan hydrolase)